MLARRSRLPLLNVATLLFAPQPLAYARGSVRRRFGAANVRERMRNYLCLTGDRTVHRAAAVSYRG